MKAMSKISNTVLKRSALAGTALLLGFGLLVSCGGGGGGGSSTTPVTPPSGGGGTTNRAPVFSSPSAISINENTSQSFLTIGVSDPDGNTITRLEMGGADAGLFEFDADTLKLSVPAMLDFENAEDVNSDNVYALSFEAEDSNGAVTTHAVSVSVLDVPDSVNFTLDPSASPSDNFELDDWKVQLPINEDGGFETVDDNTRSDQLEDYDLGENCVNISSSNGIFKLDDASDYTGCENRFFHTGKTGGVIMRAPVQGARTSTGTQYTRTEFREMLRRGNRSISTNGSADRPNGNNWAFSSAPQTAQDSAGGVDGNLKVTMAVNAVTTTGENGHIGRLVIGQIHAADDEPIRLYYRKLPGNSHGSIYLAHERSGTTTGIVTGDDVCGDGNMSTYDPGDDVYCEMLGSRDNDASNPSNGLQLGEVFSYEIDVVGNAMVVTLEQGGTVLATQNVEMSASGYDIENDYMYFKAGVYHLNNSGDLDEFAQVTIYQLDNSH